MWLSWVIFRFGPFCTILRGNNASSKQPGPRRWLPPRDASSCSPVARRRAEFHAPLVREDSAPVGRRKSPGRRSWELDPRPDAPHPRQTAGTVPPPPVPPRPLAGATSPLRPSAKPAQLSSDLWTQPLPALRKPQGRNSQGPRRQGLLHAGRWPAPHSATALQTPASSTPLRSSRYFYHSLIPQLADPHLVA
jgi:hypothetical protein